MYIYVVTLRIKAPEEPGTKKSSLLFGRRKPPVNDGLPENMILVDSHFFDPGEEFAIIGKGATVWRRDFHKIWRGRIDAWAYSEYLIIDDINQLDKTIEMLMARAEEHMQDHPLLKAHGPLVRITNDNTLPGLEEYALTSTFQTRTGAAGKESCEKAW